MKDYREILERITKERGRKSGRNWLLYISKAEQDSPDCKFSEKSAYYTYQKLRFFFVNNYTRMISGLIVRKMVYSKIRHYDENYVSDIDNLFYIIDLYRELDDYTREELLDNIEKIFNFQ